MQVTIAEWTRRRPFRASTRNGHRRVLSAAGLYVGLTNHATDVVLINQWKCKLNDNLETVPNVAGGDSSSLWQKIIADSLTNFGRLLSVSFSLLFWPFLHFWHYFPNILHLSMYVKQDLTDVIGQIQYSRVLYSPNNQLRLLRFPYSVIKSTTQFQIATMYRTYKMCPPPVRRVTNLTFLIIEAILLIRNR